MASYFESDKVAMFPSTYRSKEWNSKFTSEKNFVNIINSVVDTEDGYVLSTEQSLADHEPLKVVIHGYYFEIEDFVLESNTSLYVAIRVERGANALVAFGSGAAEETVIDGHGNFYGLTYSSTPIDVGDTQEYKYYQLHVAQAGELLHKARFSSNSIFFDNETRDDQRTVTDLLNSKQNKAKAGNGIKKNLNDEYILNDTVSLTDEYNSVLSSMTPQSGHVGGDNNPVFVEHVGSSYIVKPVSVSSGKAQSSGSSGSTNYIYTQAALIVNGSFSDNGVSLYASQGEPVVGVGKPGDFWFKYSDTN